MHPVRTALYACLYGPYLFHRITGTGPFGRHRAEPLPRSAPAGANPLIRALFAHHEKQFNEAACSVASVVTLVNSLGALAGRRSAPATQRGILETVAAAHWKARIHGHGYHGRRGLPLACLAEVVQAGLETYGIAHRSVTAVRAEGDRHPLAPQIRRALFRHLSALSARGDRVILAHFDQGALVPTLNIPHISPVGGFDRRRGRVTVLDVDPDQTHPYRVSFDTFYRALASDYHQLFRPFGYGRGGYVCVRLS